MKEEATFIDKLEFRSDLDKGKGEAKNVLTLHQNKKYGHIWIDWGIYQIINGEEVLKFSYAISYEYHKWNKVVYGYEGMVTPPDEANKLLNRNGWNTDEL